MNDLWDKKTQLHVLEYVYRVRARYIDPEALDKLEIPELHFTVSPNDILHNVIEVRRAKRAAELNLMGRPPSRDMRLNLVSELGSLLVQ